MQKLTASLLAENIFGPITNPNPYGDISNPGKGIVGFANNILKLVLVGGGIFVFINFISAGFSYIQAGGEPKKLEQISGKIVNSIVGLVLMAGSFVIAAILGQIIFGDATAILNPKIYGPQ